MSFNMITAENTEPVKDVVGAGYTPLESGVYQATIDVAYATKSNAGSQGLTVRFSIKQLDGVRKLTHTFWVTKRTGENYYTKDDKNYPLPSFTKANDLTLIASKYTLAESPSEIRTIETKKDTKEQVPVLTELSGKQVSLCVLKVCDNATTKVGNDYVPTNEKRYSNDIDKVLDNRGLTNLELQNNLAEPEFAQKWLENWQGKFKDNFKQIALNTGASSVSTSSLNIG